MKRLAIVAVGLALVVGIGVGGIVGNPFGYKASASTAAVGGRLIELGTIQVPPQTTGEYSMMDVRDCAQLYAMFQASDNLQPGTLAGGTFWTSPDGSKRVGATQVNGGAAAAIDGVSTLSVAMLERPPYVQPSVWNGPTTITTNVTGWLWCVTSPSYAVGGFAELPPLAGPPGGSGMGGATYAVLAGAAAGVLAFAVLATLSVKRRRVR
jgi:hypothetical protein